MSQVPSAPPSAPAPISLTDSRLRSLQAKNYAALDGADITYNHAATPAGSKFRGDLSKPEESVRADLYLDLLDKYAYTYPATLVMEKLHKIGHPHKKTDAKIDILVKHPDGRPFMVIELKSPDEYERYMESSIETQLFKVAAVEDQGYGSVRYLIYHTRWYDGGTLHEKTVCIDYQQHRSFDQWHAAGRPNLRAIPSNYGIVRVPQYVRRGDPDLRTDVTRDELQRLRTALHNVLYGGGKYQNELFFNLVGLFLVKIYDEKETVEGEAYQFQVFFEDGNAEPSETIYKRMNTLYRKALQQYLGYTKDEIAKVKDIIFDAPKVRYVVEVLQDISFTVSRYDVIGEFFEGIVRGEFKQSKGQYLTHTNLVRFMVAGLELGPMAVDLINKKKRLPRIIDPSCGSGAFLIESMRHLTDHVLTHQGDLLQNDSVRELVARDFPEFRRNAWAREYIHGIEINGDLAVATKVNMVGHGDGSANIEASDALKPLAEFKSGLLQVSKKDALYPKPVNEQFDIVISNPPFSITVDRETATAFPANYVQGEDIWKRLSKKGKEDNADIATELLFVERYYQLLCHGGRLAVVLPESVFDTSSTQHLRLFILKYFHILSVVAIPDQAFAPYTTTKTCILFAQKKTPQEIKAWDDAWSQHAKRYEKIVLELSGYLSEPGITSKLKEIARWHESQTGTPQTATESEQFLQDALEFIKQTDPSNLSQELLIEYLTDFFAPEAGPYRDTFRAQSLRKRSLLTEANKYLRRDQNTTQLAALLQELLGSFFDPSHSERSVDALLDEYSDEIRHVSLDWWVSSKVLAQLPTRQILLAQAEEVGYKRGIRGEDDRPNDLYVSDADDAIVTGLSTPASILDHLLALANWA